MSNPLSRVPSLDWSFLNGNLVDDVGTPAATPDISSISRPLDWGSALELSVAPTDLHPMPLSYEKIASGIRLVVDPSSSSSSSVSEEDNIEMRVVKEDLRTSFHFEFEAEMQSSSFVGGKKKDHPSSKPEFNPGRSDPRLDALDLSSSLSTRVTRASTKKRKASNPESGSDRQLKAPYSSSSFIEKIEEESSSSASSTTTLRKKRSNLFRGLEQRALNGRNVQPVQYFHDRQKYGKLDPNRRNTFNNGMYRVPPTELGISSFKVAMGKTNAYFYNKTGQLVCFNFLQGVNKWSYSIPGAHGSSLHNVNVVSELTSTRVFALGVSRLGNTVLQIIGFDGDGAYFVREKEIPNTNQYAAATVGNTFFTTYGDYIRQRDENFNIIANYLPPRCFGDRTFKTFGDELVLRNEQAIAIYNQDPSVPPQVFSLHNKQARISAIHVDRLKIVCGLKRTFSSPAACCVIQREIYPQTKDPVKFIDASTAFSVEKNPHFTAERQKKKLNKADYVQIDDGWGAKTLIKGETRAIAVEGNMAYLGDSSGIVAAVDLSENDTSHSLHLHDDSVKFLSISNQILASADDTSIAFSDIGPSSVTQKVFYKSIPVWNHEEPSNWSMKSLMVVDGGLMATMDNSEINNGYVVGWQFKTFLSRFQEEQEAFQLGGRIVEADEESTAFVEETSATFLAQQAAALEEFADEKDDT